MTTKNRSITRKATPESKEVRVYECGVCTHDVEESEMVLGRMNKKGVLKAYHKKCATKYHVIIDNEALETMKQGVD